jgi:hypothetical protein
MVLVGATCDDTGARDAGSAYLFSAATGTLVCTLLNPTPAVEDYFGHRVAIAGNTAIVGADGDDAGASGAGAACLFDAASGTLLRTLANPTPGANDLFGNSVAISDRYAFVGAPGEDGSATDRGAAYLFDVNRGTLQISGTARIALAPADSTLVQVFLAGSPTPGFSAPLSSIAQWDVTGGHGDDELILDFANGSPLPGDGVAFHGGDAGTDRLALQNVSGVGPMTCTAGQVLLGALPPIRYTHASPVLGGVNQYAGGTKVSSCTLTVASATALPAGNSLTIGHDGAVVLVSGLSAARANLRAVASEPASGPAPPVLAAATYQQPGTLSGAGAVRISTAAATHRMDPAMRARGHDEVLRAAVPRSNRDLAWVRALEDLWIGKRSLKKSDRVLSVADRALFGLLR